MPADLFPRRRDHVRHLAGRCSCSRSWCSRASSAGSRSASDDDVPDVHRGGERDQDVHAAVPPLAEADPLAKARRQKTHDQFHAVDDVSFTVGQGESVGVMGLNGSGKSTLLKLISGVMRPDSGRVLTRGRVAGLIATGRGLPARS